MAGAASPTPPTPGRVLQWAPRSVTSPLAKIGTSGGTAPSWDITDLGRKRRQNGADLWNGAYTGDAPDAIQGAIHMMGDKPVVQADMQDKMLGPEPILNQVFQMGTMMGLVYEDEFGQVNTTTSEYYESEAGSYLEEEGFYREKGYTYNSSKPPSVALISTVGTEPAPITLVPTSSINPPRPRTVAAGYDPKREVLTVIFRDGTFYNYYGVGGFQWWNFVRARSKGRFIKANLDGHRRGAASVGSIPQEHRESMYRLARTAQVKSGGYNARQKVGSKRGGKGTYGGNKATQERSARRNRARAEKTFSSLGAPPPPGTIGPM